MWKRIKKHRFDYFLFSIIGMLLVSPFFPAYGDNRSFPLASCFYTFAVLLILSMLIEGRRNFIILAMFYAGLFIMDIVLFYTQCSWHGVVDIAMSIMHGLVLVFLLIRLLSFLFKVKHVLSEHIKGGIAIYFLLGILWGLFYKFIFYFNPHAFVFSNPESADLFYFSYVTLATLGYGDIVPANSLTQMLAVMEAMLGQVFLAIFISRLMGFRIAQELVDTRKELIAKE